MLLKELHAIMLNQPVKPLDYLATLSVCSLGLFLFILAGFDWHFPLVYQSDALSVSALIKTILETGWYLHNNALAAPGVYDLTQYPFVDLINLLFIKLLTLFSHNYIIILNIFYLCSFPLTAVASLFVFRYYGLTRVFALVASLLFTFLPYHFLRGENHLFLSMYFVVPLYLWISLNIFASQAFSFKLAVLVSVFSACCGFYYAFFGAFFILMSGILAAVDKRVFRPFMQAIMLVSIIFCTIIINIAPSLFAKTQDSQSVMIHRSPVDAEIYGLKIMQMLLPVDGHTMAGFNKAKAHYNKKAPLVNENHMASLGVIASLGFLTLLILLFIPRFAVNSYLFLLSRLTVFAVLLGTIGGLGAVFAYAISPMIRSYNRISVFIAFFSLCAFFLVLQKYLKPKWHMLLAVFLLIIGLLDEIPLHDKLFAFAETKKQFTQDQLFIASIEAQVVPQSLIFQLPVMGFPESMPVYNMHDHDPLRGYLHSHQLKWSYGAFAGSTPAKWQTEVSQLAVSQMLSALKAAGFAGIYIDRYGYPDQAQKLVTELHQTLSKEPLISANTRFVFFVI